MRRVSTRGTAPGGFRRLRCIGCDGGKGLALLQRPENLHLGQRLLKVCDQVVSVLDTDAQPHELVGNAQ